MILDEWVEVVWNSANRKHYEAHGYQFTKVGHTFKCSVKHIAPRNYSVRLRVRCDECLKEYTRTMVTYTESVEKYGKYVCTGCTTTKRNKAQAHSVEKVRSYFESVELIPLFEVYTENKERLPYRCPEHPEEVKYISLSNVKLKIKKGTPGCPRCITESKQAKQRLPFDAVLLNLSKFDVELLTPEEDYLDSYTKLSYTCNKHPDFGPQTMRAGQVSRVKNMCYKCSKEGFSGSNHPCYQPNATIDKHLRLTLENWKKEQFIIAKGHCYLSGSDRDLQVHHLVPMHQLRDEAVKEAGVLVKPRTRLDVTEKELEAISSIFLQKHYARPVGVVLSTKIHKMFHSLYGNRKCDADDFLEFKERYLGGEVSDKAVSSREA